MDGLKEMEVAGRLSCGWRVAVTYSDHDNPETTFSLEPAVQSEEASLLPKLQTDANLIASCLEELITMRGRKLQANTAKELESNG